MKKNLLLGFVLFCVTAIQSQTEDKKWNVGAMGGLIQYSGDMGQGFYKTDQAAYGFAGVSISRYLGKHFDVGILFTRGEVGYINREAVDTPEDPNYFLLRHNTSNLLLKFYFTKPEAIIRPYLMGGVGIIWYEKVYDINNERFEYSIPTFGGGIQFRMGPVVSLQLQETFMYSTSDNLDHISASGDNDAFLYHSVGLTFNLGKRKDADNDGVTDKNDKCSNTPTGVIVDAVGCPLDRDADGVADYLDNCADVAGLPSLKGCPDKDMDGITDKEDLCPDVFGPASFKGCPDSDKDGIADVNDKCPGTISGYKVDSDGCTLDNDKDGIVNEEDLCPELAGILSFKGCPDTDGDGVSDKTDRCPAEKGSIENKGCPEIPKLDIQKITVIAGKIYFETGSAKLKLISNSALDDLAEILRRNVAVNLTVEGHTDSDGEDAYNIELSQKRTESVKSYLISQGIAEERLTAIGYGETRPIADNKKEAGKAKNRRVELKTSY